MESSPKSRTKRRQFDQNPNQQKQTDRPEDQQDNTQSYPRKESGCIDPCPHYECILSKDICDTNCHRCMDNPCLICQNNYDGECYKSEKPTELKKTLLRPDVIAFINEGHSERMGFVTKDIAEERRYEYAKKLNEVEDKEKKFVRKIKNSKVPNFILKIYYRDKITKIKEKRARLEGKIKSQQDMFDFD